MYGPAVDVHISLGGPGDIASRVYRQLVDAILDGRLRPGERLPPTRELARGLAVARNTVSVAYDRLAAEGFVVARVGAGTFVVGAGASARSGLAAPPVAESRPRPRTRPRTAPAGRGPRPRPIWNTVTPGTAPGPPLAHDFRVGTPDPGLFPLATWRRLVAGELRASAIRMVAGYAEPAGRAGLRAAVARYFGVSRSVHACAEDVLVTQGAQQALDLVGRVVIEPGDLVAVEEPGYPAARLLFRSLGARVMGYPRTTRDCW
jgi:GntR family transcriptional regulator/MocR family aminotransferase